MKDINEAAKEIMQMLSFQYKPIELKMLAILDDKNKALYASCKPAKKLFILDNFAGRLGL